MGVAVMGWAQGKGVMVSCFYGLVLSREGILKRTPHLVVRYLTPAFSKIPFSSLGTIRYLVTSKENFINVEPIN